jgi:hypothetical protein
MQELERLHVEPLEVVGDQHQRRPSRKERPGRGLEQSLSLLVLRQRLGGGKVCVPGDQLRKQPCQLGQIGRAEAAKALSDRRSTKPADQRAIGHRPSAGKARAPR